MGQILGGLTSGLSSIFGGTAPQVATGGLSSLTGAGDLSGLGGVSDPSGLLSSVFGMGDPSIAATDAITGNAAGIGPTGAGTDLGGNLSGTTPQPGQQAQAPPQTNTQPDPQATPETPTQAQLAFNPSGTPAVAGPTGWTAPQDDSVFTTGRQGLAGAGAGVYGSPPGTYYPGIPPNARGTYGLPGSDQTPVTSGYPQSVRESSNYGVGAQGGSPPAWAMNNLQGPLTPSAGFPAAQQAQDAGPNAAAVGGTGEDTTATPPAAAPTSGVRVAPTPQNAPAGRAGPPITPQMPNMGMGNIVSDIMRLMSGNPQAIGSLIQDFMRMNPQIAAAMGGGQQGMGNIFQQLLGGQQQPGAQGQAAAPWLAQGQAAPRGTNPMMFPPAPPGTRFVPGQGLVDAQGRNVALGRNNAPAVRAGPSTTVPDAGSGATPEAPSRKSDGTMPSGRAAVAPVISAELKELPKSAIQGILYSADRESGFNPSSRVLNDQHAAKWRGTEAANAHGLFQEGADTWPQYVRWLAGRDWRDPKLQTQFLVANLKSNYPALWATLKTARSPEEAASAFTTQYLKPARRYQIQRLNEIRSGAVRAYAE